jgi:hypothetical protein
MLDCIENYGTERTCRIPNQALHFMVCGLHQSGSNQSLTTSAVENTKASFLVRFLNEVLGACQSTGLQVVATACDMG